VSASGVSAGVVSRTVESPLPRLQPLTAYGLVLTEAERDALRLHRIARYRRGEAEAKVENEVGAGCSATKGKREMLCAKITVACSARAG
jgi:hypothetical protein